MRRAAIKRVLLLIAVLCAIGYLGLLTYQHGIHFDPDSVLIHSGDYYWRFDFGLYALAQLACAAMLFAALAFPQAFSRVAGSRTCWPGAVLGGLLWTLCWLRTLNLVQDAWPMQLLASAALGASFYALWRVETSRNCLSRLTRRWDERQMVRSWVVPFTLGAVALCTVSGIIYHFQPRHVDAQSQVAQARILLAGKWALPVSQAVRDVIHFPNSTHGSPAYSQYPPGHIVLMLPFMAMHLPPVAVNIVAGSILMVLVWKLGGLVGGSRTGFVAALLLAISPWFWVMNGSAMNQGTTVVELAGAAYLFLLAWRERKTRTGYGLTAFAGLLLGWCFATRPLTAFAHIVLWGGAWAICVVRRDTRQRSMLLWPMCVLAGTLPPLAGFAYYNLHTTGHVLLLQYQVADPEFHLLGFIQSSRINYPPIYALHHTFSALVALNWILFGLVTGSVVLLIAWLVRTRLRVSELVMLGLVVAQVLTYTLYHFSEVFMGPRFWYEAMPYLVVLAAIPLAQVWSRLPGKYWGVILMLWVSFLISNVELSARTWLVHFRPNAEEKVRSFVRAHEPYTRPTAIVIPQDLSDAVGWYMSAGSKREPMLLFIKDTKEKEARALPELSGFQWLSMLPPPSSSSPGSNSI